MAQTINVDTRKLVNDLNSIMESLENIQARYERINELYESVKERWQGPLLIHLSNVSIHIWII